ncbi:tetratricopeptide repeat protein [Trichlorobacter lovleyi]|uniref:O-linked N-acetylglucosamine transferase, SPINDLY family protein n=1 Tax=Trichlorobacter lovleyi TaxID=313985 RepID=UPI0022409612|nr:tetratricopeptide repeat protein [Trichlorobacter lovleyi]QOX79158.1 tetratricopeptide repeat protein [Trichlorobacter lovleyi]
MFSFTPSFASSVDIDAFLDETNILFQQGKYEEALARYLHVLNLTPNSPRVLRAVGMVLHCLGRSEEALDCLEHAISLNPGNIEILTSQGVILKAIDCKKAAVNAYREIITRGEASSEVLGELGSLLLDLKQYDDAKACLIQAVSCDQDNWNAHYWLGLYRKIFLCFDEAIVSLNRMLELKPNFIYGFAHLAKIRLDQGRHADAILLMNNVLHLKPNSFNAQSLYLFWLNYQCGTTAETIYRESIRYELMVKQNTNIQSLSAWDVTAEPDRQLRIGLVSPDFRRHPVGYFVQAFLLLHDPDEFHVVCYSDVEGEDDLTPVFRESADSWRRILGITDEQLSKMIQRDRIDILVDLAGHTDKNRLSVFMMKPAPVQVTWAGYMGTTGLSTIDYLISDRFQSPEGSEQYTVEQIVRLPDDYICYCPPDYAPEVTQLPALSNGYITFCSFNNLAKVTEEAVALWSEILQLVPGSRFFIKNPSFSDQGTVRRYLDLFKSYGIDEKMIIVEGKSPHPEMIARYSLVDIQLDTQPYSGGLTTLESLWMGVPVVTLPGELFSSRHSLTHLMNVGLEECVASNRDEFIAIACTLAEDLSHLSELRLTLRQRMMTSPVCDGLGFTENIQQAFRKMWVTWCEKQKEYSRQEEKTTELASHFQGDHIDFNDRGNLYADNGDFDNAIAYYQAALEIKPSYMEASYNLGLVYFKLGALDEALKLFKRAIRLDPDFVDAYLNISTVLIHLGRNDEALIICEKALQIKPDFPEIYNNIGTASLNRARPQEALQAFRKAVDIRPEYVQAYSNILYVMHFLPGITERDIFLESQQWDKRFAVPLLNNEIHMRTRKNALPLRLGFVSPDFYQHPVGYFIQSFFMLHDRGEFEIYCYSDATIEDDKTEILRSVATEWRWVHGMPDEELYHLIRHDEIDILIDLAGHSNANRLLVFAQKPSPVQVTWAGYVGTTGLTAIDYLISDRYQSPDSADDWTTEEIVRLPGDYISYCPPEFAPDISPLPALTNGYVTFCSFNRMAKISEEALELWLEVLRRVEGARLFMKNPTLADPAEALKIKLFFQERGIRGDRLLLEGPSPHAEIFERYHIVDIQLDTLPYSGGLTTLESLWMGVPVVTLPGKLFSSRHSLTHLTNVGLAECVASTPSDFISIACALANDLDYLAGLRTKLRLMMAESPLCDGLGFTEKLQDAFRFMWKNYSDKFGSKFELVCDSLKTKSSLELFVPNDTIIARYNEGIDSMERGRLAVAEEVFREVIKKAPDFFPAHNNLAMTISKMGRTSEAESVLRRILERNSTLFEVHNNLGNVCLALGRQREALSCFRQTLELNPLLSSAYSNILFCMNYLPEFSQQDIFDMSIKWRSTLPEVLRLSEKRLTGVPATICKSGKCRIGYVSADFRFHSVSFFIRPLFEHHDRNQFELFCFSNVARPDAVTYELQQYVDSWVDISDMTDVQSAQCIGDAGIDILVDLSGHTAGNRLGVFFVQPAPIQVSWLGYPNTTGLTEIGYRLTDIVADPASSDRGYTESLYRIPNGFLCYQPPEVIPEIVPLPSEANNYITFCSFNNVAKLTEETIVVWSKILKQVPDSRLILKSSNKCTENLLHRNILRSFESAAVNPERITILKTTDTLYAHLNAYCLTDIALDTYPYNGTTTTFEALLMGVPVVTLSGDRHASRVGASILSHLGEPGLIASSPEEFCATVVSLVNDRAKLQSLRSLLRPRLLMSTLCDGASFVKRLETAYLSMIASYQGQQGATTDE